MKPGGNRKLSSRYPEGRTTADGTAGSTRIPLQQEISTGRHAGRRADDPAIRHLHLLIADDQSVARQNGPQDFAQERGHAAVSLAGACSDVAVDKDAPAGEPVHGGRQRIAEMSQDHMIVVGNAARMCGDLPVENEDLPVRHDPAQVIVCASVPEPQFQNDAGVGVDGGGGEFKTIPLSREAPDRTIQS